MAAIGGDYPAPTSEESYNANLDKLDMVYPNNGGDLQADGSWFQETWKINPDWPQSLPGIASGAGHTYMPVMTCDATGVLTVLDSPSLQQAAADGLIDLALNTRFDAPWDGVMLDLEQIPLAYQSKLSDFYRVLSEHVRGEGLELGIWTRGRTGDTGPDYENAYTNDYAVLAETADFVEMGCYGYWNPLPRSMAPDWWERAAIEYAIGKGILPHHLRLGCGLFSRYWVTEDTGTGQPVTYAKALELAGGFSIDWIESNVNGTVREWYSDLGAGCLWIHDDDTLQNELTIADEYNLSGVGLFVPGMEDDGVWQVLADWRMPRPAERRRTSRRARTTNWREHIR